MPSRKQKRANRERTIESLLALFCLREGTVGVGEPRSWSEKKGVVGLWLFFYELEVVPLQLGGELLGYGGMDDVY